jgi:hypothetical protein
MPRGNQLGMASAPPNQNRWPHRRLIGGTADNRVDDAGHNFAVAFGGQAPNGNLLGVLPPWRTDGVSHMNTVPHSSKSTTYVAFLVAELSFFIFTVQHLISMLPVVKDTP